MTDCDFCNIGEVDNEYHILYNCVHNSKEWDNFCNILKINNLNDIDIKEFFTYV